MIAPPSRTSIPDCPVCGSDYTRPWLSKNGYEHGRCNACGHGFVFPVPAPAEIEAYYQSLDNGLSSDCSWQTEAGHKRQLWRQLLQQAERSAGLGPLLDLGCGGGQFLQLASEWGWTDSCGVEPSPKAVHIARNAVSCPVYDGTWKDVKLAPASFAAIALLDVLEHDGDPNGLLDHCLALLRPGGCLMITVPNIHGLSLRCFGSNACVVIPPEHLSYFTAKSLRLMLLKAGYTSPRTTTCDLYLKEWLRLMPGSRKTTPESEPGKVRRQHYAKWHRRLTSGIALSGIAAVNVMLALSGCGDQLVASAFKPRGAQRHG